MTSTKPSKYVTLWNDLDTYWVAQILASNKRVKANLMKAVPWYSDTPDL